MFRSYLLLLVMPVLVTAGQILLKKNSSAVVTGRGFLIFMRTLFRPGIIAALLCVAAAPLLYIYALNDVPLSEAFAFNSLNYILVFISSRYILKEKINILQTAGVILISAGFLFPFIAEAAGA